MKIAVISDTRKPTTGRNNHGLGNTLHDLATAFARNHEVTLFAAVGSQFDGGKLITYHDDFNTDVELFPYLSNSFDIILDGTHHHQLHHKFPTLPIVNRIGDRESASHDRQAVVESRFMQNFYTNALFIRKGIDFKKINLPQRRKSPAYILYMAKLHTAKGFHDALQFTQLHRVMPVIFAGENLLGREPQTQWVGEIIGDVRWRYLYDAVALLQFTYNDASPRTPLEAAYCGTPTLTYTLDASVELVEDGLSGFHVENVQDAVEMIAEAVTLPSQPMQEWVQEVHNIDRSSLQYLEVFQRYLDGERW